MKKIWEWLTGNVIKEVGEVIDNLTTTKEEKLEAQRLITQILEKADKEAQEQVTERWKADMSSDSKLSKNIRPAVLIYLTVIFTACAFGPDYKVPNLKTFDTFDKEYKTENNNLEVHNWWKKFNDPTLNKLINIAKESNLDIKTAYLNIKKSRLSLNMSEDDFLPNAAIGSGAGRGQLSENSNPPGMGGVEANKFQVGLSVSWEIDLF